MLSLHPPGADTKCQDEMKGARVLLGEVPVGKKIGGELGGNGRVIRPQCKFDLE